MAHIVREPLLNDMRDETGPFDVIGDVHGCRAELETLLAELGYRSPATSRPRRRRRTTPTAARRCSSATWSTADPTPRACCGWRWAWSRRATRSACCGNHENKLVRALRGRKVTVSHGLAETLAQLAAEHRRSSGQRRGVLSTTWSRTTCSTTAGWSSRTPGSRRPTTAGRRARCGASRCTATRPGRPTSSACRCATRGPTTTAAGRWCSTATPRRPTPEWVNNTMCLDTGCVFGGRLTALRYPEKRDASPLPPAGLVRTGQAVWRRRVPTRRGRPPRAGPARARRRRSASASSRRATTAGSPCARRTPPAALEVMSRFAVDPHWLLYLPPTMAPVGDHRRGRSARAPRRGVRGLPRRRRRAGGVRGEAHGFPRGRAGVPGSGARPVRHRRRRHGLHPDRTRSFFERDLTEALLDRVRAAVGGGLWDELGTDWLLLDAELLPWSAKAGGLLTGQYAPVGAAAVAGLSAAVAELTRAGERGVDVSALLAGARSRADNAGAYRDAYRRYCRPTDGLRATRAGRAPRRPRSNSHSRARATSRRGPTREPRERFLPRRPRPRRAPRWSANGPARRSAARRASTGLQLADLKLHRGEQTGVLRKLDDDRAGEFGKVARGGHLAFVRASR